MAMTYTQFDELLRDAVTLRFYREGGVGDKVEFQFPPRILNDGRKGEWNEDGLPGTEPVATYEKSGPREISLTWTYIVDGGAWTTERVSNQVRLMRGYFARTRDRDGNGQRNLIAYFQMWRHGGTKEMTCRIRSVDVKHSETVVAPCVNNRPRVQDAYPLRTDITVELRLWTKGGREKQVQDLAPLKDAELVEWY